MASLGVPATGTVRGSEGGPLRPPQLDQTDVATFLASINASCSLDHGRKPNGDVKRDGSASSKPDLPISATVSLIDAQIDQLEQAILNTVSDNRAAFTSQMETGAKVEHDLDDLYTSTVQATDELSGLSSAVSPALYSYHAALSESSHGRWTIDAVSALLTATVELERAESLLSHGEIVDLELQLPALRGSVACFGTETAAGQGPSDVAHLGYLTAAPERPNPAVTELKRRIEAIERDLDSALAQAWNDAVRIARREASPAHEVGIEITIRRRVEVLGEAGSSATTLSSLLEVLTRRGEAERLLRNLARQVLDSALRPLLQHDRSTGPKVTGFDVQPTESSEQASLFLPFNFGAESADRGSNAVMAVLAFLKSAFFDQLEPDQVTAWQVTFARELVPHLVPLALSTLNDRLPTTASALDRALEIVQETATDAQNLESCLRRHGFASTSRSLDEDEDANDNAYALRRWSEHAGAHYSKRLAGNALDRARRLILAEGQGSTAGSSQGSGWESEIIEVDSKLAAFESAMMASQQGSQSDAQEVDNLLQSVVQPNSDAQLGEAAGWDDFEEPWSTDASLTTRPARPSSARSTRPASNTGSGTSTPRTDSPSGLSGRKPKAKLGGVRVIRPQDQLGSGPFNSQDVPVDDASWGLDDEDDEDSGAADPTSFAPAPAPVSASSSSLRSQLESSRPSPSTLTAADHDANEDDDPWFSSAHDGPEGPASTDAGATDLSAIPATQSAAASSLSTSHSVSMQPSFSSSSASSTSRAAFSYEAKEADGDEDDAWGLTEEQVEETRVASSQDNSVSVLKTPPQRAADAARLDDAPLAGDKPVQADQDDSSAPRIGDAEAADAPDDTRPSATVAAQPAAETRHATAQASVLAERDPPKQAQRQTEEDDWGLEEDENPVQQSRPSEASERVTPSTSARIAATAPEPLHASKPTPGLESDVMLEDGDEDDAWGLREAEAKRLSMLLPPSGGLSLSSFPLTHAPAEAEDRVATAGPMAKVGEDPALENDDELDDDPWNANEDLAEMALAASTHADEEPPTQTQGSGSDALQRPVSVSAATPREQTASSRFAASTTREDSGNPADEEDAWNLSDEDASEPLSAKSTHISARPADTTSNAAASLPGASPAAVGQRSPQPSPTQSTPHEGGSAELEPPAAPHAAQHESVPSFQPVETMPPAATIPEAVATKEACSISKRSIQLVELAKEVLADGLRLWQLSLDATASADTKPPPAAPVLNAVSDLFDLHRSLMPVAHGEVLRDVPSLAMQFSNDCEYIATELDRIVRTTRQTALAGQTGTDEELAEGVLPKLDHQARLTRALGQRWFDAQMATQTKALLTSLANTPFSALHDARRFERCERSMRQLLHALLQLSSAWKPILPASSYLAAMGQLVEVVLQKVLAEVEELEDIGDTESQKLADIVKMLGGLDDVFVDPRTGKTKVALYVPSWFKASYAIEILTGSLVDIEFLAFEAHALVDYSRRELSGLIKALFTDTVKRARLLDKIEKAQSDVLLP